MRRHPTTFASVLWSIALAVPLVVYAAVGAFSRYTADDYCWAGVLREQGFINAQAWWYVGYSPRYAFTFIVNLVELAGPRIVPILPALAIVVWAVVLTWTLRRLGLRALAVPLALLIEVATFSTAPDLPQSLYWQTGMLTYLLPLVLATFLIGWIRMGIERGIGPGAILVCTLTTVIAGGLSEAYLIPQNVALTLALASSVIARQHRAAVLIGAALLGGVLALALVVLAPATPERVGGSPADLRLAASAAVATAIGQVVRLIRYFAPVLALCLLGPAVLASAQWCNSRERKKLQTIDAKPFAIVTLLVAAVVPFCYFPSFYASNGNPPARSLIVPGSMFIAWAVFASYCASGWLRSRLPNQWRVPLTAVLALVPLGLAVLTVPTLPAQAAYAARWDAEDEEIRELRNAGARRLEVPPLPRNFGESFVTTDENHFFNRCVARYYGLDSIVATADGS